MHAKLVADASFLVRSDFLYCCMLRHSDMLSLIRGDSDLVSFGESPLPTPLFSFGKGIVFEANATHPNCWYVCPILLWFSLNGH